MQLLAIPKANIVYIFLNVKILEIFLQHLLRAELYNKVAKDKILLKYIKLKLQDFEIYIIENDQ